MLEQQQVSRILPQYRRSHLRAMPATHTTRKVMLCAFGSMAALTTM